MSKSDAYRAFRRMDIKLCKTVLDADWMILSCNIGKRDSIISGKDAA